MLSEFMTVETLATFAGLTAGTMLVTQFIKTMFKFTDFSARILSIIVAILLTFSFSAVTDGVNIVQGVILTLLNSIIVAMAATGGFETIADPKAKKHS